MKIYKVTDPEFIPYGRIIEGYDNQAFLDVLEAKTPLEPGVAYVTGIPELEAISEAEEVMNGVYGGMPVQFGYCNGFNTKLNCLEYHRDSELNLSTTDFILLVAKQDEIVDGMLDTAKVKAFFCPAGVMVEVYATTLHYAPCSAKNGQGFRVMIVLPKGTNTEKPSVKIRSKEDTQLTARNKWLLAHPESSEAKGGAVVGLTGVNIDISSDI